ncbi:tetratricopeptide repeat-containing sensor histidine kinase [Fulvivirga lutimaris]|uniref:tetratricopeptide repeat-containing sensor histidine kinase n=1 Tax=Fulvivirga lutimaris TaxID=1819566 RepID=UPI0012BD00BF|nr:tetratricopeptide repeat-containing sensor histidine kinase [Fulvivirga lutimaris]MTI41619.1 tetratricopeptide repeat protein [Fulvivirga lutimaris]
MSIILLFAAKATGQNMQLIDSLKTVANNVSIDQKIAIYNQLGWQYRKLHPDSSIYFLNKSRLLIDESNNLELLPECYNFLGVAYLYKGDYLFSYDYHEQAKEQAFKQQDSLQYAHALNSLGRLYEGTAAYDKAIEYYDEALIYFQNLNDNVGLAYIYSSLATFYQSQKNFVRAEEMCKQGLELRMQEELWAGVAFSYLELAKIYNDWGKPDKAFTTLQSAQKYSQQVTANMVLKAEVNTEIASLYRQKGEYAKAQELMNMAQSTAESISNQNLFMKVYLELGRLNYDLKKYDEAIKYDKKVVVAAEKSAFMKELREGYLNLSKNYEKKGDITTAYENFKKYNEIEKRFLDTEKARLAQQHESRIALETRARENELLRIEQQKNEELIEEQNLRNYALLGIAALMFVLLVMFMIYSYRRKRDNLLLTQQKDKLADINLEKDTLMNILAHDLKAPFNRIYGLCDLAKIDKGQEEQYIKMMQDMSSSGLALIKNILEVSRLETGEVLANINSVDLQQLFRTKIENYADDAKAKSIDLKSDLKLDSNFVTNQLFLERIIDNLISNAIKYSSKDSAVEVRAFKNSNALKISVKDHGPGFTEDDKKNLYQKFKPLSAKPTAGEASNGLGLSLVKTLVDKLHGTISLSSEVGKGSTFNVEIPELHR